MPELDVIVVTYNSARNASKCLIGMISAVGPMSNDVSLIFVDNSPDSTDATFLEPLVARYSNIKVVTRPDNPGFAGGCNYGVSIGVAEWVAFLNPDLTVNSRVVDKLLESVRSNPDPGFSAFAVAQRTDGVVHQGIAINSWGWFIDRPQQSEQRLIGPSGGAGLYRREVFVDVGGFREVLFAWGEDAELAIRLDSLGYKTAPLNVVVDHLGGHSVAGDKNLVIKKQHLLARNRFAIAAHHYSKTLRCKFAIFSLAVFISKVPQFLSLHCLVEMILLFTRGYLGLTRYRPIEESISADHMGVRRTGK